MTDRHREHAERREQLHAAFRMRGEAFRGPITEAGVGHELSTVLEEMKAACADHGAALAALDAEFGDSDGR